MTEKQYQLLILLAENELKDLEKQLETSHDRSTDYNDLRDAIQACEMENNYGTQT